MSSYRWRKPDLNNYNKCILRHGKGEKPPMYITNTKATFHYRAYKVSTRDPHDNFWYMSRKDDTDDNNAKIGSRPVIDPMLEVIPEHLLDDSRAMNMEPMELISGREFKLEIWETIVKTMKVGEIARFACPFELVQEYPHVSRALRDMHYRRTGKSAKELDYRGYHFCSMALSYNTGHPDLDAFTRERCPLIFEIELLKVEQPGDYKMDHWAMTDYDKKRAVPKLKEEGNKLYEEGEYAKAAELYFEALCYVEEQLMEYRRDSPSWNSQIEIKVPLLLNYSQCKLLLKEYVETIRHCSTVIEYEPKNVKAYFRRAKAYAAQWDEKEARADFAKAVELDPSLAKAAEKELKAMTERLKEKDKEERERLKGKLFS